MHRIHLRPDPTHAVWGMLSTKSVIRVSWRCHRRWKATVPVSFVPRGGRARLVSTANHSAHHGSKQSPTQPGTRARSLYRSALLVSIGVGAIGLSYGSWQRWEGENNGIAPPGEFVKYALLKKEEVSSTCSIFTLRPATSRLLDTKGLHDNRALTSVQFKQPQLQIARNYTSLPPVEGQDPQELRFLIRREHNGEVSGFLHRLSPGAEVEIRGPSVDYVLPEHLDSVVFLAGGTGIAPAIQTAAKVGSNADVHIMWANRSREDCEGGVSSTKTAQAGGWSMSRWWTSAPAMYPLEIVQDGEASLIVRQLDNIKDIAGASHDGYGRTKVDYFVDEEGTFIRPADVSRVLTTTRQSRSHDGAAAGLIIVSGPEGFVNRWAGPKQWANGHEAQGPLGGILSRLDLRGWKVVKL